MSMRHNFFEDDSRDSTSTTSRCFFDDVVHYPGVKPRQVTHPSTSQARRRLALLTKANVLPLCQIANCPCITSIFIIIILYDIALLSLSFSSSHFTILINRAAVNYRSQQVKTVLTTPLFSERELTFTFAICYRPSVCRLSTVCNVCAPYSGGSNFRQYFYGGIRYLGHPLTSTENFTEIVRGEPFRLGS